MRLYRLFLCAVAVAISLRSERALAQKTLLDWYQAQAASTQKNQPQWATPLVTTSPRIEQGLRTDFVRQTTADGQTTWNYGNTNGLQFIPFRRIELRLSPPPYMTHSNRSIEDGFGDVGFRMKYRLYGSNEEHHNAIATVFLRASVPTGKSGNGSCCATLAPTLELGKGIRKVALTTSLGGSLPVTNATKLGRQIAWNNAVQLHATKLLWLETEFNSTYFLGGKSDGKTQTFVTPGLIVSRIPLVRGRDGKRDPLLLSVGAGEQIALTHFKTYDHLPIFTARLRF